MDPAGSNLICPERTANSEVILATSQARPPLEARSATCATIALIGLRIAYAYNWLDLGPALPSIGQSFAVGVTSWGFLIAAFLAGAGIFQVPAGLLAQRWGTRRVSLLGALLLGAGALACAGAPAFWALLILRFVAGAGAGLFFSPAIALVASLHPEGGRGTPVGVFSSAFSAGAGLGVFASALLVPLIQWRGVLAVGGIFLLGLLVIANSLIPREAGSVASALPRPSGTGFRLPPALRTRAIWAIGFAFIGLEGASLSAGQFFVPYAQSVRDWTPLLAGSVGALFVFPSVFGGPVGGNLAERRTNRRTQLLVFTAIPATMVALVPFAGVALTAVMATAFSFAIGMVYAIMYIIPPYLPGLTMSDEPLAIGLMNGIQLAGGAVVASAVAATVQGFGYPAGFMLMGVATLGTLVLLVAVPPTGVHVNPGRGEDR